MRISARIVRISISRSGFNTSASRALVAAPLVLLVVVLGTLQFFASVALRSRAQPGAWITFVSPGAAARLARIGNALPLSRLRLAFAREAFATGDLTQAASDVARLPPSPDAFALRAALARSRGDIDAAVRDDLAAGDFALLSSDLDTLTTRGELTRALATERLAVVRLTADRTAPDALAEAEYHLGIFEEARSQMFRARSPERRSHEREATGAYARALALAPLDDRYLLAAANQALNFGAWADAAATFERAREVDPASADPLAGLGDLAYRRGDVAAARAYLARARALDARSAAVRRLAAKLAR